MDTRQKSYRIARRAGYQGARPSGLDSPEVEKYVTESISLPPSQTGHQDGNGPNFGPTDIPPQNNDNNKEKNRRKKWNREENKEVIYCFYFATERPVTNVTDDTYTLWCERNTESDKFDGMSPNSLANRRRYIINHKKLTEAEITEIREKVRIDTQIEDPEIDNNIVDVAPVIENADVVDVVLAVENVENITEEDRESVEVIRNDRNAVQDLLSENEKMQLKIEIREEFSITKHTDIYDRDRLMKIRHAHKFKKILNTGNSILEEICFELNPDLTELNELIFSTGKVLQQKCGIKVKKRRKSPPKHQKPKWEAKIDKEIATFRREISLLEELQTNKGLRSGKARKVLRKYNIKDREQIAVIKEELKQKLQVKAQRLRRFNKRTKFYRQNKIFETDAKKFYREIGKETITVENVPSAEEVTEFWNKIWGEEKEHNQNVKWIQDLENNSTDIQEQEWENITTNEIKEALKKSHKWKSPGLDQIPNFWLDTLPATHTNLAKNLNKIMQFPNETPKWFCQGTTYLLAKNIDTANPKNFRPITCLSTSYKLLTSILTERTYKHIDEQNIFPGCRRGSYGCKDQLLINKMILENAHMKSKNLSTAWIDYKKAFDSVPHSWILKTLEIYKVSPVLINFLKSSMNLWETNLTLSHSKGTLTSKGLKIKSGIFQGDSLSPLLFCLALIPLSKILNDTGYGYKINNQKISHLFYMDDLKLYAHNDGELEGLLKTVKAFSDDIKMEFGLDKCAKATFTKGKLRKSENVVLDENTIIKDLEQEGTYKYLGVNEGNGIQHSQMKEKIKKECIRRVRSILKTELNSKNRITAINTLAIPVVTYSFNVINWNLSELKNLDAKIRKQLTSNRMHHPKSDVDRLYIPRKDGGRGMIQLELSYKTSTIGLHHYLESTNDWMLQLVYSHENGKKLHSVIKESRKFAQELEFDQGLDQDLAPTILAKKSKKKAKNLGLQKIAQRWQDKPLHGRFVARSKKADVDELATHQWLRSSGLKGETEGFILAAQDQSLFTRNYQANILHNGADPKCRFCHEKIETIDHLVSGCSVMAGREYTIRHDRAAQYLHWKICLHYSIDVSTNWYEHNPQPVTEGDNVTILWNFTIHTDRTIKANRPDITIKDKKEKTCLLIDMAVPMDGNISNKVLEKLSKYLDLEIEIGKMWHLNVKTIPVVIGALGMIKKGTQSYLDKIPGKPSLYEIQKIVLNSTSHILRRALSI